MIERDLESMQGLIEFFVEVSDPENRLGIAQMVARELLADGDRVRTLLPAAEADALLLAQARLLDPEATGTPPNPQKPASEPYSSPI
jgi:hypothetical protein